MKITKNKNKYFSYLQKQFSKFAVFLVVISMFASFLNINPTYAYFSDEATSTGNTFTAGTLDLATSADDLGTLVLNTSKIYSIINQGGLPFKYETTLIVSGGSDTTFCGQLSILVKKDSNTLYSGGLSGLNLINTINPNEQDDISITISDAHNNSEGKVCSFNFISKAWQTELDYSQGFTDTASTKAVVYSAGTTIPSLSSGVVLNEFLPNPTGLDTQDGILGEWIEFYNNSDHAINMTGWYTEDASSGGNRRTISSTTTYNGQTIIGAKSSGSEWLVLFMNDDILNNSGPETITLYDSLNISQNSYSYDGGTYCDMQPTPNDNNDTNPSGNCTSVPPNKSFARIPDGTGTWIDPIPTPGATNELTEEIIPEIVSVVPEESPLSATLPEEIPPASPDEVIETEDVAPGAITDIPPATEPEKVVTEVSETVETPISEVIEPKIIQKVEPVATELTPAISETEAILEPDPVVEVPAVEPAKSE